MKESLPYFLMTIFLLFGCSELITTAPFGDTIVVLTFDDAHASIFENAYPLMQEFGYAGANYVPTGALGASEHLTLEELHILEDEGGWETGGHTISHANLTQISLDEAKAEIAGSWQFLRDNNLKHSAFALPSGNANAAVIEIIKEYFDSIRTSEDFKMKCPIDRYSLGYYNARNTEGSEKIITRILRGIVNHECVVIIGFHRIIQNKNSHSRAITPQEFRKILEFIRNRNLRVMTISEAIREL